MTPNGRGIETPADNADTIAIAALVTAIQNEQFVTSLDQCKSSSARSAKSASRSCRWRWSRQREMLGFPSH
jgi:hypothetical protein